MSITAHQPDVSGASAPHIVVTTPFPQTNLHLVYGASSDLDALFLELMPKKTLRELVLKLEGWFKSSSSRPFYKFISPCTHKLYKEGDSWCEELGISHPTFLKHFGIIATRWGSRSEFSDAMDPFLGKPYASFYDRRSGRTYFVRNNTCAEQISILRQNCLRRPAPVTVKQESAPLAPSPTGQAVSNSVKAHEKTLVLRRNKIAAGEGGTCEYDSQEQAVPESKNFKSRLKVSLSRNNKDTNTKTNLSSSLGTIQDASEEGEEEIIHEMKKIWHEVVGTFVPGSTSFLRQLRVALKELFGDCLIAWRSYCRKVASSKFLMGEVSTFRAWIMWAIKPEAYARIMQGGFSLGDRALSAEEAKKEREERATTEANLKDLASQQALDTLAARSDLDAPTKELHRKAMGQLGLDIYKNWFKDVRLVQESSNTAGEGSCPQKKLLAPSSFVAERLNGYGSTPYEFKSAVQRFLKDHGVYTTVITASQLWVAPELRFAA